MEITCEGCKAGCNIRLFAPFRWKWSSYDPTRLYSTQGEAIIAKMEQFKACPRMPTDIRLTNLTKEAPETPKTYRDIPSIL
jgi:hypothetical protein